MACKCVRSVSKSLTMGLPHTSSSWALAQCSPPSTEAVYTLRISKVQYLPGLQLWLQAASTGFSEKQHCAKAVADERAVPAAAPISLDGHRRVYHSACMTTDVALTVAEEC